MNIYIISSVREASPELRERLEKHVRRLEASGHTVYLPHRDTDQNQSGSKICYANDRAISNADEIHVFYNSSSQGSHFDLGIAYALNKSIRIIEPEPFKEGKNFMQVLRHWQFGDPPKPYRVWDIAKKQMHYCKENEIFMQRGDVLMKFTGIVDKFHIPIYEGDYVYSEYSNTTSAITFTEFRKHLYNKDILSTQVGFKWGNENTGFGLDIVGSSNKYVVKGNIYEN